MQVDFSITQTFCTFAHMKVNELTADEYAATYTRYLTVFDTPAFATLNADKTDAIKFISFTDDNDNPKLGIIMGQDQNGSLSAPYSAPFAGISLPQGKSEPHTGTIANALALLSAANRHIHITPPPRIYGPLAEKMICALFAAGFRAEYCNVNHYYNTQVFDHYTTNLDKCRRNRLNASLRQGYRLERCELARAYEIIRLNREHRGYPLRMTLQQLQSTSDCGITIDNFILTNGDDDAAAAVVYRTTPQIAQVIYWGDKPDNGCKYAMNLLAYRLFEHYSNACVDIIDIGPSAEHGVLSEGLAEFKENIGCLTTPKFSFIK